MLEKNIRFKDLDGNDVEEVFCFHMSKAEIAEMELLHTGGLAEYIRRIAADQNGAELMATFKDVIRKSVGRRSEDGKRFIKTEAIADDFMQTDAYSELFMQLVTEADAAVEFINGIVPKDLLETVAKQTVVELPKEPKKLEDYTEEELLALEDAEWTALLASIKGNNIPRSLLVIGMKRK